MAQTADFLGWLDEDDRPAPVVATGPGVVRVTDVDRLVSIVRGFMT